MPRKSTKSKLLKSFDDLLVKGGAVDFADDDEDHDGTQARNDKGDSDVDSEEGGAEDDVEFAKERSKLRTRSALKLAQVDPRYKGKRATRKQIDVERGNVDVEDHEGAELGFMFEGADEDVKEGDDGDSSDGNEQDASGGDEDVEEEEEEETEDGLSGPNPNSFSFDGKDFAQFGSISDEEEDEDDEDDAGEEEEEDDDGVGSDDDDVGEDEKGMRNLSEVNVADEVAKGRVIKRQLTLWESLLECRIQLQKVLQKTNRLPQHDTWKELVGNGRRVKKSKESVYDMLDGLLDLQTTLVNGNAEVKEAVVAGSKRLSNDDDIEPVAKKQKVSAYAAPLADRHQALLPYRDAVVQRWNDKTRLSTNTNKKNFSGFESSTLKQIEHVLQDKSRLVRRTQTKRSAYRDGIHQFYYIPDKESC
jgi:protein AATF/BFR2